MADSSTTRLDAATAVIFQTTALNAHPSRALAKAVLAAADSAERPGVERLVAAATRARTTISFFASVIKSGESWTLTCENEMEQTMAALAEFGQQPTGDEQ